MKTFIDSGVLLTAWKGTPADSAAALAVITDTRRSFVTGDMVRLELLPKPAFYRRKPELDFYQLHFDTTTETVPLDAKAAQALAEKYGLAAADALNLAAAIAAGAQEFVTSELPGKPPFRVKEIKVTTLHAAA